MINAELSTNDLYKGLLLTGDEGYGKNTLKQNIQKKIIDDGHGLTIIDFTGNNINKLLEDIKHDNIMYIEPTSLKYGFNILNCPIDKLNPEYNHMINNIATSITEKLKNELNNNNKRIHNIIYNFILKFIQSKKIYKIRDAANIFQSKNNAYKFIQNNNFEDVFINRFKNQDDKIFPKIYDILCSWIENETVEKFISGNNFNIYNSLKNNKILLLDLSKLQNIKSKKLISQFFLNQIWNSIQTNVTIENGHFLFINNYENYNYNNIKNILSNARRYKLGICISLRYYNQLQKIDRHTLSILTNRITFNTGPNRKKYINKLYDSDIIHKLDRYEYLYYNTSNHNKVRNYVNYEQN